MLNIYCPDQSFLSYADFSGKWDGIPVEVWCEEIEESERTPKALKDFTTYIGKDGWIKPEGSDNWSYIGPIRIIS